MEAARGTSEARGCKAPSLCFVGAAPIHARPQVRSEGPDPRRQQLPVKEDERADKRSRSAALQSWSCTCCFLCLKNGASLRGRVHYKMLCVPASFPLLHWEPPLPAQKSQLGWEHLRKVLSEPTREVPESRAKPYSSGPSIRALRPEVMSGDPGGFAP